MNTIAATNGADTDILVVGAGPTGLALAATLHQHGVRPVLVDKLAAGNNTSRAAVIHAHALDVLEQLGVAERLIGSGMKLAKFSIRDRDRTLVALRFDELPSRHSCLLMIPQDRTESILAERLAEVGGSVRRGVEVKSLAETPSGVEATMATPQGTEIVRARYVVGADGMNSVVRETARIGFSGARYEESFILADVEMEWGHGRDEVMIFFSPAGLVVVAPLPTGTFRIVATLDVAPSDPGVSDVQSLLDRRGPTRSGAKVSRVIWGSRFRIHHRVADHYRRGPFLLVGDAAHVHSPAGGQGMNTGLVDACVLGRLLADVVTGRKGDSHLDQYETLRRPAAEQVLHLAGRLTKLALMKSAPQRAVRNLAMGFMNMLPPAKRGLEMNLSGLARRDAAEIRDGAASSR